MLLVTADTHAVPAPGTPAARCVATSGVLPAVSSGATTGLINIALVVVVAALSDSETALTLPSVKLFG
ncbi:hypothetical protein [Paraburkholderia sp. RL17-337-BIB-A]|uniref:hypothetical protein n=1 Tax=Paraburkholderia sp. RL17-337-BIB-A TaxID=3031636 RepID=UPI0038BCFE6E